MALTYKDLVEQVAQRELGIIGRIKTLDTFREAGIELDDDLCVKNSNVNIESLKSIADKLQERFGPVAIMACKIPLNRLAKQGGLELPPILKL